MGDAGPASHLVGGGTAGDPPHQVCPGGGEGEVSTLDGILQSRGSPGWESEGRRGQDTVAHATAHQHPAQAAQGTTQIGEWKGLRIDHYRVI